MFRMPEPPKLQPPDRRRHFLFTPEPHPCGLSAGRLLWLALAGCVIPLEYAERSRIVGAFPFPAPTTQ
jgi:hypothetical protein